MEIEVKKMIGGETVILKVASSGEGHNAGSHIRV